MKGGKKIKSLGIEDRNKLGKGKRLNEDECENGWLKRIRVINEWKVEKVRIIKRMREDDGGEEMLGSKVEIERRKGEKVIIEKGLKKEDEKRNGNVVKNKEDDEEMMEIIIEEIGWIRKEDVE